MSGPIAGRGCGKIPANAAAYYEANSEQNGRSDDEVLQHDEVS